MSEDQNTPAQKLVGLKLDGGWAVERKVERLEGATGGNFSCGYVARSKDGNQAYIKALDFSKAMLSPDPAMAFQAMTEAFNFERQVCEKCKTRHLTKVVTALGDGKVEVAKGDPLSVVQYLMFELADGDIRKWLDIEDKLELAWLLRTLHNVSTGLRQLHMASIAHQDLKPSNVLVFKNTSKVGDLGRAAAMGATAPHDDQEVAGDYNYAPPELLYGYVSTEWNQRRFGCDAYHMGSFAVFLFARVNMTALLLSELPDEYHWRKWGGVFEDVLPYLRDAFGRGVKLFGEDVPEEVRGEMVEVVRQLCEPDPRLRGHPRNRAGGGNQYSLERYISKFDILAKKAEFGLLGVL